MTRVLLDTNIFFDVLLERYPHAVASGLLWQAVEQRRVDGLVAAHAVTTIHYILVKYRDQQYAALCIPRILRIFEVAAVDDGIIRSAERTALHDIPGDFEDAVTAAAAEKARCNMIVTRDPKGFRHSPVLAIAPQEALHLLAL